MKKISVVLMAVILTAAMGLSAFAADFVPSIEAKTAPEVVEIESEGESYGSLVIEGEDDSSVEGVPMYDENAEDTILEFYLISAAEKTKAILPQIEADLTNSQKQIAAASDLGKLDEGLDEAIMVKIDEFYGDSDEKIGVEDLVVSDLFDASLIRDKKVMEQIESGKNVRFIISPNVTKDEFFVLLHNIGGEHWEAVNTVQWTNDGKLMITVNKLDVFAIAVVKNADIPIETDDPGSPQTGSGSGMNFFYAGIAVLCVGAAVVFFTLAKKKRTAA